MSCNAQAKIISQVLRQLRNFHSTEMFWNPVPLEATQHGATKYLHVWEALYTSIVGFTPTSVYTQLSGHTQIWGHTPMSEVHPDIMVLPINIGVYTGA